MLNLAITVERNNPAALVVLKVVFAAKIGIQLKECQGFLALCDKQNVNDVLEEVVSQVEGNALPEQTPNTLLEAVSQIKSANEENLLSLLNDSEEKSLTDNSESEDDAIKLNPDSRVSTEVEEKNNAISNFDPAFLKDENIDSILMINRGNWVAVEHDIRDFCSDKYKNLFPNKCGTFYAFNPDGSDPNKFTKDTKFLAAFILPHKDAKGANKVFANIIEKNNGDKANIFKTEAHHACASGHFFDKSTDLTLSVLPWINATMVGHLLSKSLPVPRNIGNDVIDLNYRWEICVNLMEDVMKERSPVIYQFLEKINWRRDFKDIFFQQHIQLGNNFKMDKYFGNIFTILCIDRVIQDSDNIIGALGKPLNDRIDGIESAEHWQSKYVYAYSGAVAALHNTMGPITDSPRYKNKIEYVLKEFPRAIEGWEDKVNHHLDIKGIKPLSKTNLKLIDNTITSESPELNKMLDTFANTGLGNNLYTNQPHSLLRVSRIMAEWLVQYPSLLKILERSNEQKKPKK